jgi:TatD DNase family protein
LIYNTHSHLHDPVFDATREAIIERVLAQGMRVLLIGYTKEMNERAIALAEQYDCFDVAVGIHPNHSANYQDDLTHVQQLATHPKVVAIGECGLDYHWDTVPRDIQKQAFMAQLELATHMGLPIVVHMRDATEDTYAILTSHYEGPGVMHCYSGNAEFAKKFVARGLHLGIGGPITFKNSQELQSIVESTDLSKLVVETDDPYLAPEPFRGQRNHVDYVTYVIDRIASIKGMDQEAVIKATAANATVLFGGER